MADKSISTVYIGNLDERVSERVLYDILIQAGHVVDLHIPRDKETNKPKGYAFAEYESEEIAEYAVKLFSGLVTLYKRTLKFGISGQDKSSTGLPNMTSSAVSYSLRPRPYPVPYNSTEISPESAKLPTSCRFSEHEIDYPRVSSDKSMHQPDGYRYYDRDDNDYGYSRRVFGAALDSVSRSRSGRYNMDNSRNQYPY